MVAALVQMLTRLGSPQLVDVAASLDAHLHRLSHGTRGRDIIPAEERET